MKTIVKIVANIGFYLGCIAVVSVMLGMIDIVSNTDEYVFMYNISEHGLHWQYKSVTNLIIFQTVLIAISVGYTYVNYRLKKVYSVKLFALILFIDLLLIINAIRVHRLYVASGYDHYPGFDPSLF